MAGGWSAIAEDPQNGRQDARKLGYYFALAQVGLEMVAPIALGAIIDHYTGWTPWGTLGGVILGFVGGFYHLFVLANRLDNADADKHPRHPENS